MFINILNMEPTSLFNLNNLMYQDAIYSAKCDFLQNDSWDSKLQDAMTQTEHYKMMHVYCFRTS